MTTFIIIAIAWYVIGFVAAGLLTRHDINNGIDYYLGDLILSNIILPIAGPALFIFMFARIGIASGPIIFKGAKE